MITALIVNAVCAFVIMGLVPIPYETARWQDVAQMYVTVFILTGIIIFPLAWIAA